MLTLALGAGTALLMQRWGVFAYLGSVWGHERTPSAWADRGDDIHLSNPRARARALLLHGLNFDPEGLRPLAEVMHDSGLEVLAPRLAGHRGIPDETHAPVVDKWRDQMAIWASGDTTRPLICAGYSLGGLLTASHWLSGTLPCRGLVLFAPALALRTPPAAARALKFLTPSDLLIPSGIPDGYRHFDWLGLSTSFGLVEVLDEFHRKLASVAPPDTPALVVIDPRDQVIDPDGVIGLIRERFPNWKLLPIRALDTPDRHLHHLIVDEAHLGSDQWRRIGSEIDALIGSAVAQAP